LCPSGSSATGVWRPRELLSTRGKPAQWIFQRLKNRGGVDARLLDLRDFPMPFFDQPVPPAMPGHPAYENEVVKKWTGSPA
jgi:hypothetical protein